VHWHAGIRSDGMDSHGESLRARWPEFCIGLLIFSESEKAIPSRVAMQRTITTSALYQAWPSKVSRDLAAIKQAIGNKDFQLLGKAAESNATTMHATMLSAWPPIIYSVPETLVAMQRIWELRNEGLQIYFTQDAGPNLKLLFLQRDIDNVLASFPSIEIIQPFAID
jgi:diphosphomevalonate decarboxylase